MSKAETVPYVRICDGANAPARLALDELLADLAKIEATCDFLLEETANIQPKDWPAARVRILVECLDGKIVKFRTDLEATAELTRETNQ